MYHDEYNVYSKLVGKILVRPADYIYYNIILYIIIICVYHNIVKITIYGANDDVCVSGQRRKQFFHRLEYSAWSMILSPH